MDEVAFITATCFSRQRMGTIRMPIQAGIIVELVGNAVRVGRINLAIKVDIFWEKYSLKA